MRNLVNFFRNNLEEIIQVICGLVSLVCVCSIVFVPLYEKIGLRGCLGVGGGMIGLVLGFMYLGHLFLEEWKKGGCKAPSSKVGEKHDFRSV